ncbi:hypothetical protein [Kingella potus]|uniref:hypothetical protein n=1 Tax=Kingella potus TaxID=265175 RepID=UPI001FD30A01|nr:hypothetical protein [Kingella potus]UOP00359.1 hypothetical protein LVJ84_10740 [Kingella potus]
MHGRGRLKTLKRVFRRPLFLREGRGGRSCRSGCIGGGKSGSANRHPQPSPARVYSVRRGGSRLARVRDSARIFIAIRQPRAWLRHTPYLSGGGRLKKHNLLFRRPARCPVPYPRRVCRPSGARVFIG